MRSSSSSDISQSGLRLVWHWRCSSTRASGVGISSASASRCAAMECLSSPRRRTAAGSRSRHTSRSSRNSSAFWRHRKRAILSISSPSGARRSPRRVSATGSATDAGKLASLAARRTGCGKRVWSGLIELDCSPFEIMALTGHRTMKEIERYGREYLRERAATQSFDKWIDRHAAAAPEAEAQVKSLGS